MKAAKANKFRRQSLGIKGAEVATQPRSHAEEPAGEATKKANPQRMEVMRRANLANRKDKDV